METKQKITLYSLSPAQRQSCAAKILNENLKRVRAKLGTIETQLTPAIGHRDGVGAFSVNEIMYVYGINRSTAYRWKKFGVHPEEYPILDSMKKIRWTDQLDPESPDKRRMYKPWNPRLSVIAHARATVRSALKKLREMDEDPKYERFPMTAECEVAADELYKAAGELDHEVYFALHDIYDDPYYGGEDEDDEGEDASPDGQMPNETEAI